MRISMRPDRIGPSGSLREEESNRASHRHRDSSWTYSRGRGSELNESPAATAYYEQPELWGHYQGKESNESDRISKTLSLVPSDTQSVLDIGCGDGRIVNRLERHQARVCGIDTSREALGHVVVARCLASADRLPFRDKSFDLVICSEVLEHLPIDVYSSALGEIQRIAAKQVIITVPNSEDLRQRLVNCPVCNCRFHPYRHVRSFRPSSMRHLLASFDLIDLQLCGEAKYYPDFVINLARLLRKSGLSLPSTAVCPQCGYRQDLASSEHFSHRSLWQKSTDFIFKALRYVLRRLFRTRKRHTWVLAVYRNRTGDPSI